MSPDRAAFERDGQPIARPNFYAIACDPARSVAVEACAGAGKTWMLVSRMLRALLDGCAPQDMLAITFTKKAAGEMRQRLQQWLQEFANADDARLQQEMQARGLQQPLSEAQLQRLRGLHAALLHSGRPVQIRTFHSWFAALLRSAPLGVLLELGLPPGYQLLEDDQKARALVWRRFQTRVAGDMAARADYADAVAQHGRFNVHKALASALAKRTEFALADAHGVVDRSVAAFGQQFAEFATYAQPADALQDPGWRSLLQSTALVLGQQTAAKCRTAATALEQALATQNPAGVAAALLTKEGEARKLGDTFAGADVVRRAQDFLLRLQQVELQQQAWLHQQRMARLTRGLLADYAQLKRERGWIDMGDLECAALRLLSDEDLSGWVQERLDARVRHLLIDEFQDTNPLQWQALHAWLASYAGAGRAPSVFIVGDPKQSIYRFRRAEPQVFRAAKTFVQQGLGGVLLSCDHTRRNAQAIIASVNAVMLAAQAQQAFDGFRAHTSESNESGRVVFLPAIAPLDKVAAGQRVQWRDSLSEPRVEAEESRKVLECRQAARWLHAQLQDGTLQPSAIMVLARKREHLGLMQAELATLHIPAQQPEKTDLMDFAEVQDMVALLDALVSPRHDLALARALKSPLFGASDDDLVALALMRTPQSATAGTVQLAPSWMQRLQGGGALPPALQAAAQQLAIWQRWVQQLPPHDALSAIYTSGDVRARFAAAAPAAARVRVLANLNALLQAALAVDGGRYSTAYSLVRALRAGGNPAPVRSDSQAVRLLTIHGAKGLEAPLVLMLDTDAREPNAQTMDALVDWPGEARFPRRFVFLASESRPPACVVDALANEQAARSREELNALYVALTRTQHTLVLSSFQPRHPNPASWWSRLLPHAQAALVPPEVTVAIATLDTPGETFTLPVLPVLPAVPRPTPAAATRHSPTPADAAAADSEESLLGQAMHRLLELLPTRPGGYAPGVGGPALDALWPQALQDAVRAQFQLHVDPMQRALDAAIAIAGGEAAWAWDTLQLRFHGNEVPLGHGGRAVRIDRLVQTRDLQWWVLDYKSRAAPQNDPDLCAQLEGYRSAIAGACPGQVVRAAFLTPQGVLIELKFP